MRAGRGIPRNRHIHERVGSGCVHARQANLQGGGVGHGAGAFQIASANQQAHGIDRMPDPPGGRLDLGHFGRRGDQRGRDTEQQQRESGLWHKAIVTEGGGGSRLACYGVAERIPYGHLTVLLPVVQILCVQDLSSGRLGRRHDECVPE